ncbi:MAG: thioredoxin domain-containing protein [Stagnimonas sp.]|nr:thioredoxin domain-containing protein [Stagnimonas sp.]
MKRRRVMVGSAVVLLLAFVVAVFAYSWLEEQRLVELAAKPDSVFNRPHSPIYGPADAKVRIVEFLDPACETCRAFYSLVKDIVDSHRGRVQLVVRYTPFHAGADTAVAVMEAARLQGLFWPVTQRLLREQSTWGADHNPRPDLIWDVVDGTGLNLRKAREDAASAPVRARVEQDLADAKALAVTRTPGFFVNGRPLKQFGADELKELVSEEVDRAYGKAGVAP